MSFDTWFYCFARILYPLWCHTDMTVDGVNKVRKDGAYKLPEPLGADFEGEYLAAFRNERGNIELKRVDRDGGEG